MNRENKRIIDALESKYAGNEEALEAIEQAKKDIEYIERKEAAGGYTGQSSKGKALELEAFLHDWY